MTDPAIPYRVLARKYRPATFAELIGQEAMVRTLSNAIATGRIAHAFVLTGVRGVGKTTTARILARAFNCVGPDGKGGPTIEPCGACEPCRAIAEDRHVDVIEMDAASRTGVDEIRELIDGVRYRPVAARFKIYIIDEVHMLSKNAFNALLKTLEEPPPDVKFIFATTEIHKVPITVLSRCQRFSLRRVPVEVLTRHFAAVAESEKVLIEPGAVALIARAADGSVRDGLSLLDQAIALGGGAVVESAVRDMLGIADRGLVFALMESVLRGDAAAALGQLSALYQGGADPVMVLQDLLELTHFLTRLKTVPQAGEGDPTLEGDRARALPLADKLSVPVLTRTWQMLLKGIGEAQTAPSTLQAAEMVLVRLCYVADLPAPAEIVRAALGNGQSGGGGAVGAGDGAGQALSGGGIAAAGPGGSGGFTASIPRGPAVAMEGGGGFNSGDGAARMSVASSGRATAAAAEAVAPLAQAGAAAAAIASTAAQPAPETAAVAAAPPLPSPQSFDEVVALFDERREAVLRANLINNVHLVRFEPGRIEFRPTEAAPQNLANRMGQLLSEWTGARWVVSVSREAGAPTLREQAEQRLAGLRNEAAAHPLVRAVMETFPGAVIEAVRELAQSASDAEPAPAEATGDGGPVDEIGATEDTP
jgi:DNA polymerase-3 subunit gamma/tau